MPLRGLDGLMSQQLGHFLKRDAFLQKIHGKGVAGRVESLESLISLTAGRGAGF